MKFLLLGRDGQVGWELQRSLAPLGEVRALGLHGHPTCDLRQVGQLIRMVREARPDVIVNAAAYTAVDRAESEPDLARQVNAIAPGLLAREAAAQGALLVHYSSDHVFDGSGTRPWQEDSPRAPLNVYGATKREGEDLIAAHSHRYLILRTSWVYGARGGNFASTILRLAGERDRLTVVDDQHGAPTGADLLADVTAHMVRAALADASVSGVYHVAAAGETTWNAYARLVVREAAKAGVALRTTPDNVEPVPSHTLNSPALRPHNSRLDTRKVRCTFGLVMPDWQHGVVRMLQQTLQARASAPRESVTGGAP